MGNVVCGLGPAPGVHDVHIAALDGDFDEVKRLLLAEPGCVLARCEAVADGLSPADAGVAPGMTVLAIAARHGRLDMFELLLSHPLAAWAGLELHCADDRGLTPLMHASARGEAAAVRRLLRAPDGLEGVALASQLGCTPLFLAYVMTRATRRARSLPRALPTSPVRERLRAGATRATTPRPPSCSRRPAACGSSTGPTARARRRCTRPR